MEKLHVTTIILYLNISPDPLYKFSCIMLYIELFIEDHVELYICMKGSDKRTLLRLEGIYFLISDHSGHYH